MFVIDSHCDSIALSAAGKAPLINRYNFSKMHPQLQLVALFCNRPGEDAQTCYARAKLYINTFFSEIKKSGGRLAFVKSFGDIKSAFDEKKHAALLAFEGGGAALLENVSVFRSFFELGVRVFGPAWQSNAFGCSNRLEWGEDSGISDFGKEILREGNRLGMIFDLSHLSDRGFYQLCELSQKPIIASHSNLRSLCPHSRNLSDEMLKCLISRGGMMGLNLCREFIHKDKEKATVEGLFAHIDRACELGAEKNLGFGGDIDGIGGDYPPPLDESDSIHDRLISMMLAHGYSQSTVEDIAWRNYYRFFEVNLPRE